MRSRLLASTLAAPLGAALFTYAGLASALDADPSNYEALLPTLKPGDTLNLAAGTYTGGLDVTGLNGTESMPIVIQGAGDATVFEGDACCNTVEITDSSHVVIRKIKVDGKGIDGVFGVSAKGSSANTVHHITIEDSTFVGQNASQQTVGISTKTPTFGWIIRRNVIDGAGTGMYLGNSNHAEPFVGGLIEHNLVRNTIGYDIQIKDQDTWPDHPALPKSDAKTIIRHNVFLKNDQPSPDGPRPNLFVGGLPPSGPGAGDSVEIYGNFISHNSVDEGLIQAAGRVSIHDNVLVDASDEAVLLTSHDGFPLLRAHVYNNTVYSASRGIVFGSPAMEGDAVVGNLIFAGTPIEGGPTLEKDNITDTVTGAMLYVASPSTTLGQMDFYPLPGPVAGTPLDLSMFAADVAPGCDFNGASKGDRTFRGAYAGDGTNPGWKLASEIKPEVAGCGDGGGGAGGDGGAGAGGNGNGGAGAGGAGGANGGSGGGGASGSGADTGGCGCRAAGAPAGGDWLFAALGAALVALLTSRRRAHFVRPAPARPPGEIHVAFHAAQVSLLDGDEALSGVTHRERGPRTDDLLSAACSSVQRGGDG